MTDRLDRAVGAVRGLALGDALGAPASEHRTVRDPWVRQMLRKGALELDESRVLRPVVPFVLTAIDAPALVATDDTETFAVAARVLLEAPGRDQDALFDTWRALLDTPDTWTSAAQRSALLNAEAGLRPPHTGADNPAFYDDTALPGALAAALVTADPAAAAARSASASARSTRSVPAVAAMHWPVTDRTWATCAGSSAPAPCRAPATAPAMAAMVSESRPMLTPDSMTPSVPSLARSRPMVSATASGATSAHM